MNDVIGKKFIEFLLKLLDELAILWVVMACYWLWYPEFALPPPYKNTKDGRKKFSYFFIIFAFVVSFLGFIQPVRNSLSIKIELFLNF